MFFKKKILVDVLPHAEDLELINYATPGAAGMDLRAALDSSDYIAVPPQSWAVIPCGFRMALPKGFEAQVRPRSGLAAKHGIFVLNSPGTIDEDYRGEVAIILANFNNKEFIVKHGERIAQMVVSKVWRFPAVLTKDLSSTQRGAGGFGHSGTK